MIRLRYAYWAIATIAAVLAVVGFDYWVLQAALLTFLALALSVDSVRRAQGEVLPQNEEPILRSRVTHFVKVSKIKDSGRLIRNATNPFEHALLGTQRWPGLSEADLKKLDVGAPEARATALQRAPAEEPD